MKHARNAAPGLLGIVQHVLASLGTTGKVVAWAGAAVVAATPFGAWAAVGHEAAPLVPGERIEAGPFEIAIEKVVSAEQLGDVVPQREGDKLLVVVAEVTNTFDLPAQYVTLHDIVPAPTGAGIVDPYGAWLEETTASESGPARDAMSGEGSDEKPLEPVPDDVPPGERPDPTIYHIADAGPLDVVNPGVTYRVALVWEQSGTASPEKVRVDLTEVEWIGEGESFAHLMEEYWLPRDEVTHSGTFLVEPPEKGAGA
ncbi:hypothetical protein [Myceligenerans cantabricum]